MTTAQPRSAERQPRGLRRPLRTLDWYIFLQVMGPLLYGVAAFTTLFVGGELVNLASLVTGGAPVDSAVRLLLLKLPQIMVWTFPMAVLLGTLLGLSRLSSTCELVAMRASGVSFYRLMAPVLVIGALVVAVTLGMNERLVPWANSEMQRVMIEEINGGELPRVTKNVMLRDFEGDRLIRFIYATDFDRATATMHNVAMLEWRDGEPFRQTTADALVWETDGWYFRNGKTYLFSGPQGKGQVTEVAFRGGKQRVALKERPEDIPRAQKSPETMTMAELRQQMTLLGPAHDRFKEFSVQYYLRFATPLVSLIFAWVGVPLGIQHHRRATSVGFGLAVIIIFAYYVVMTLFTALGQGGTLPPAIAAFGPDALLAAVGLVLVIRARK
ncbi:MAG: LptF/LptG family permease [Bacillota bacterium]|nr:LptF/LptG family permease [Bacillota bacterium]